MSNRYARVCLEEAIKFAKTRKTFGKALTEHQVIMTC
jgi:acyl-CoA dehydrogenase